MSDPILAHRRETIAHRHPVWLPPRQADVSMTTFGTGGRSHRATSFCSWCGSMKPDELAAALRQGATLSWADRKYGWPHKAYVSNIQNRFAGLPECRHAISLGNEDQPTEAERAQYQQWRLVDVGDHECWQGEQITPGEATTWGKFYTVHLLDASPEDRDTIEQAMGLHFTFIDDGGVLWEPWSQRTHAVCASSQI